MSNAPFVGRCLLPISNHFPPAVRDALVAASQVPNDLDPMATIKAIDRAAARARSHYPTLFRKPEPTTE